MSIRPNYAQQNFQIVVPDFLYRSGQFSDDNLAVCVKYHGIKTIINARGINMSANAQRWFDRFNNTKDVTVYHVAIPPLAATHQATLCRLALLFDCIEYPVLIMDKEGTNRSGEVALLLLLLKCGLPYEEAAKQVSTKFGDFGAPLHEYKKPQIRSRRDLLNYNHIQTGGAHIGSLTEAIRERLCKLL